MDLWDDLPKCLFHRLLHNRQHLILCAISGRDNYFVVLGMNNTGIKAFQFLGNMDQRQLETIGACRLNRKIE